MKEERFYSFSTTGFLGHELRRARIAAKLTQAELGERAGVSRRWISQMEKGHLGSEVGRLMSVVRALGLQLQFQRDSAGSDDLWAEER